MVLDVVLQGFIEDGGRGMRIDSATRLGLLSHDYQFDLHTQQTLTAHLTAQ